ncbi:VanZ family protein [Salisediminibacterium halotolerans]|uniref:VanZ family protein n=1 Tax=Salisediminibacterium halotolerans TaxID=517425 RepID=UPI000EAEC2F6|nr:VanZ family protein [Salisediminibacterium halotolerans]RLJ75662.1 VanZ family protein [Actinophytocola xinjiangensis]RPE89516.1 VanZ family protein [Salisediminibacterium halotolerans]TWG36275.1 VanZ family protein [Salisediminibacterium halotolerans]GEL07377.1 hypothetical protein SHA02_07930 [Salisediminibacterium halotolerans]
MKGRMSAWVPVFLWMGVIFFFSAQPGETSGALSGGVVAFVFDVVQSAVFFAELDADGFHLFIRKAAHFVIYAILAVLILRALYFADAPAVFAQRKGLWAWVLATVYAAIDETHQLFVPGRSGEVSDVLLDSAGALFGLMLCWVWIRLRR